MNDAVGFKGLSYIADKFGREYMGQESTCGIFWALYGLVRLCRPNRVVEIGSHTGNSTAFLVQAVEDNGFGFVTAFEKDEVLAQATEATVSKCRPNTLRPFTVVSGDFFDYGRCAADFAFIDLDPKSAYVDAFEMLDVPVGGIVCAHDLTYEPEQDHVRALFSLMLRIGYEGVGFEQERGLVVARRIE